jgi:cell division protease FtsH
MLANTLLEREIMDGEEIDRLLRGETLDPLPARGNGRPADGGPSGEAAGPASEAAAAPEDGHPRDGTRTGDPVSDRAPEADGRRRGANEPSRASGTDSA